MFKVLMWIFSFLYYPLRALRLCAKNTYKFTFSEFTPAIVCSLLAVSCTTAPGKKHADLIVTNAKVYTVDSSFSVAEAFAVVDGRISETGTAEHISSEWEGKMADMGGLPVYPGFIDAHCHFYGYGINKTNVDLAGTKSFAEVLERVKDHAAKFRGEWIQGRGWDQNDWEVKEFPARHELDSLFPDRPVYLRRVDGHAALLNAKALQLLGITPGMKVEGGVVGIENGELTGILIDNATASADSAVGIKPEDEMRAALLAAQEDCFRVGLTTVDDAGLDLEVILLISKMQQAGELLMRIYAMANPDEENFDYWFSNGILKTERLHVRSFKYYADGALGSRGACLLQPYADVPSHYGMLVTDKEELRQGAGRVQAMGFQMNTHCIGDSANRMMLKIYNEFGAKGLRWRIEHAQVVNPADLALFAAAGIIPSVQPVHATSDMYWAEERLGSGRMQGAYAYGSLLKSAGTVAAGSDFPVESIDPLFGFYAAVSRRDKSGFPPDGFRKEEALTREEALRAMTAWAAWANFEEHDKGSITAGKLADFVVLTEDIMMVAEERIAEVKVAATYVGGREVFRR